MKTATLSYRLLMILVIISLFSTEFSYQKVSLTAIENVSAEIDSKDSQAPNDPIKLEAGIDQAVLPLMKVSFNTLFFFVKVAFEYSNEIIGVHDNFESFKVPFLKILFARINPTQAP